MITKSYFVAVFIILVIFILPGTFYSNAASAGHNAEKQTIDIHSFEQFRPWLDRDTDSIYVINFWATWCAPCIKEIPDFEKINSNFEKDKVKVLFVSLDFPGQVESRVVPFVNRMNMKGQVIVLNEPNANRWIPQVSESWSGAIPATLIYGRNYRQFFEKELTYDELENILLSIIK
jgi:thiol-disulfide isomerase/thioredoxin